MERKERSAKRRSGSKQTDDNVARGDGAEQTHRLRGGESEDDFVDADADSCVASRHRAAEKESDS
jgi:hypothetical protein